MAFDLKALQPSITRKPSLIVLYGVNGCGKSSFCAGTEYGKGAPNPLYMNINDGLDTINVAKEKISSYAEAIEFLDSVLTDEHDFKTLVIDAADDMERLICSEIIRKAPINKSGVKPKCIEDIGFQAGSEELVILWEDILNRLRKIRDVKKMHIVFLAQLDTKKDNNLNGTSLSVKTPKLHGGTLKGDTTLALFTGWCDILGLMEWEKITVTDESAFTIKGGKPKLRIANRGSLYLHVVEDGAHKAKNRYDITDKIDITENGWQELGNLVNEFWKKSLPVATKKEEIKEEPKPTTTTKIEE